MNKHLISEKLKDGFIVSITTTHKVSLIQEVHAIARYEGLVVDKQVSTETKIYAD